MVMKCDKFKGKGFDAFLMSQMWDCQEDRERIFRECRYQVCATDMLSAALGMDGHVDNTVNISLGEPCATQRQGIKTVDTHRL